MDIEIVEQEDHYGIIVEGVYTTHRRHGALSPTEEIIVALCKKILGLSTHQPGE